MSLANQLKQRKYDCALNTRGYRRTERQMGCAHRIKENALLNKEDEHQS